MKDEEEMTMQDDRNTSQDGSSGADGSTRAGATGAQSGRGDTSWADDVRAVAEEVMGSENFKRLRARSDGAGVVADQALAAQFDDLRLVEKARFHRARRDAGRALAFGDKAARARTAERVAESAGELAFLRLQRDVTSRKVAFDVPPGPDDKPGAKPRRSKDSASKRSTPKPAGQQRAQPAAAAKLGSATRPVEGASADRPRAATAARPDATTPATDRVATTTKGSSKKAATTTKVAAEKPAATKRAAPKRAAAKTKKAASKTKAAAARPAGKRRSASDG